ncbi:hypothetical protein, partial [Klebsiella pneumoniae]|uniref:hypothetical protein n=1 Tax=Klebsiella pneumoniae TaxID=573 RepID=UPI0022302EBE
MTDTASDKTQTATQAAVTPVFGQSRRDDGRAWSFRAMRSRLKKRNQSLYPKLSLSIGLAILCAAVLATMV